VQSYFEIHAYCCRRRLGIELVVTVSDQYWGGCWLAHTKWGMRQGRCLVHADFPAPEGPIIKILSAVRDSSDAIDSMRF
jgi:hypothetical protein